MEKLPLNLLWGALTAGAIILGFLLRLALRSRPAGGGMGASRMIGRKGRAVTEVAPEGRVFVEGEYWWARARGKIAEGEQVRVVGLDGLTLEIEALPGRGMVPRPVSAIEE